MKVNELIKQLALSMERERVKRNLSQKEFAKLVDTSYSNYRRIVSGESTGMDIHIPIAFYRLTGKYVFEMMGMTTPEAKIIGHYRSLSEPQKRFIEAVAEFEVQYRPEICANSGDMLSVIVPVGNFEDGMIWDSVHLKKIDISPYRAKYGAKICCGIEVTTNHMHPVYLKGDILLIEKRAPRDGDIGIFANKKEGRAYIRRFKQTNPTRLEPINDYGQTFYVNPDSPDDMLNWVKFGCVLTKIRI